MVLQDEESLNLRNIWAQTQPTEVRLGILTPQAQIVKAPRAGGADAGLPTLLFKASIRRRVASDGPLVGLGFRSNGFGRIKGPGSLGFSRDYRVWDLRNNFRGKGLLWGETGFAVLGDVLA